MLEAREMARLGACCSCRVLGFDSQHQHDFQPSVTLAPRDISSSVFLTFCTHVAHRHTMQAKHSIHTEIKLIKKKTHTSNIRSFSSSKKKIYTHEFIVHHSGLSLARDNHSATFCRFPYPGIL